MRRWVGWSCWCWCWCSPLCAADNEEGRVGQTARICKLTRGLFLPCQCVARYMSWGKIYVSLSCPRRSASSADRWMRMKRDKTEKRRLLQIMTSEIAASCWSHLCNWPAINCWYFDLSIMAHFAQEHWLYSILLPSSSHLHSSFQMNSGLWLMLNKLPRVSINLHAQPAGTTVIAIKFKF